MAFQRLYRDLGFSLIPFRATTLIVARSIPCQVHWRAVNNLWVMAKLLKINHSEAEDLEAAFTETQEIAAPSPNPLWERFKHDPRWLIDRWILRTEIRQFKRSPRRGGSR